MTLPYDPPISLGQIRDEFGGPVPISLGNYYRGGAYVSAAVENKFGNPIPSGPPIRLTDFLGVTREPSTVDLANYFWNHRSNLIRYSTFSSSYPPVTGWPGGAGGALINYQQQDSDLLYHNNPTQRYVTSLQTDFTYSNSGLTLTSPFFTVISASAGQINNYGGLQSYGVSPGTQYWESGTQTYIGNGAQPSQVGDGYGISFAFRVYRGQVRDITSGFINTSHAGGNRGVWTYQFILPGRWTWDSGLVNFDATRVLNIPAGNMHFALLERGGNGPQFIPPPGYPNQSEFKCAAFDGWWYNGADAQIAVNTSGSAKNLSWGVALDDGYGNIGNYNFFPAQTGHTPRVSLRVIPWY